MDPAVDEDGGGDQEEDVHDIEAHLPVVGLVHRGRRHDDAENQTAESQFIF